MSKDELIELAKPRDTILGYKLSEVINPINPLLIGREMIATAQEIELLKQWASVEASVWASVGDSVGDSVGTSVWDSVGLS